MNIFTDNGKSIFMQYKEYWYLISDCGSYISVTLHWLVEIYYNYRI